MPQRDDEHDLEKNTKFIVVCMNSKPKSTKVCVLVSNILIAIMLMGKY